VVTLPVIFTHVFKMMVWKNYLPLKGLS